MHNNATIIAAWFPNRKKNKVSMPLDTKLCTTILPFKPLRSQNTHHLKSMTSDAINKATQCIQSILLPPFICDSLRNNFDDDTDINRAQEPLERILTCQPKTPAY